VSRSKSNIGDFSTTETGATSADVPGSRKGRQKENTMSMSTNASTVVRTDLEAQHAYLESLRERGFDFNLMVADAFVRGIRDIGYKSTGTALNEQNDNGIQAGAENVHVVFGFDGPENKPTKIAIVDDGHGMEPGMLRASVLWGGTHRENDRTGFGRYGYGLPSSSVSIGRRFTVYSRIAGEPFQSVTLDVDDLGSGTYRDEAGQIVVPEPSPEELPAWVQEYIDEYLGHFVDGLAHGTVVVIEKIDRLSYKTTVSLQTHLLQTFGVTYRNFVPRLVKIWVNGHLAEPVDPLFTTPGYRFYDLDEDRAESLEPTAIEVKDEKGNVQGVIKVRYSYLPPTFPRKDKTQEGGPRNTNARFAIMKEYNRGIIVLRNGRQIDVVTQSPWTTFQNNDRFWGVEIDFPAVLDQEFSITTSKQQVVISERIWQALEQAGVYRVIRDLRKRYDQESKALKVRLEEENKKRASEQAMEDAQRFKARKPGADAERREQGRRQLEEQARKLAQQSGRPFELVERELQLETQDRPYKVEVASVPGGLPFYWVEPRGAQTVLYFNSAHRFYTDVYAGPGSTPRLRAAMEVLLFVLGENELDATGDRQLFYQTERVAWSNDLNTALNRLDQIASIADEEATAEAIAEDEAMVGS
jgi:hypothetical protein